MENTRFPHTMVIKRANVDSDGVPVTDANGNPIFTTILSSSFGYRTNSLSTSSSGDVITSDYKLALPRTLADVHVGDTIEITDYTRSFKATVLKYMTFNLGTNIWADEIRN